jgi:hypothetical protein
MCETVETGNRQKMPSGKIMGFKLPPNSFTIITHYQISCKGVDKNIYAIGMRHCIKEPVNFDHQNLSDH